MRRSLKHKIAKWEFWPFWVFYLPVFPYYLYLAIRSRSLFFFTSANPNIEFGGMFGERKSEIFKQIPEKDYPKTILISNLNRDKVAQLAKQVGFPLIAKPDVGERGLMVEKIQNEDDLLAYQKRCKVNFLLQEFVDLPLELGVFYVRHPSEKCGLVTSIVRKGFLTVVGDGSSTVKELLMKNQRAVLQANLKSPLFQELGDSVLPDGEEVVVEPIGNHSRGTTFYDDSHKVSDELRKAIDHLAQQIPHFYFGRFDLRCESYDALARLERFKVLELNGAGAEPAHIYQPGFPILEAYKSVFLHLRKLAEIGRHNQKRGFSYTSFRQGVRTWRQHQAYISRL